MGAYFANEGLTIVSDTVASNTGGYSGACNIKANEDNIAVLVQNHTLEIITETKWIEVDPCKRYGNKQI